MRFLLDDDLPYSLKLWLVDRRKALKINYSGYLQDLSSTSNCSISCGINSKHETRNKPLLGLRGRAPHFRIKPFLGLRGRGQSPRCLGFRIFHFLLSIYVSLIKLSFSKKGCKVVVKPLQLPFSPFEHEIRLR